MKTKSQTHKRRAGTPERRTDGRGMTMKSKQIALRALSIATLGLLGAGLVNAGAAVAPAIGINIVGGGFVNGTPAPLGNSQAAGITPPGYPGPLAYWNNIAQNV